MVTDAIREDFLSQYANAEIKEVDLLKWLMPQLSQSIYSGYRFLVKNYESLYNRYYEQNSNDDNAASLFAKLSQKKTNKFIDKEMPSVLISTFPICTQVLGEWKEKKRQ